MTSIQNINVIFPIAGNGVRYGENIFKPFLDATEKKFIELAKEPFNILKEKYKVKFIFIYRNDQELKYNVKNNLEKLFTDDCMEFCIINENTIGPVHTLQKAIEMYNIEGLSYICDCDHRI